eukprot:m.239072 g.239072  ORF g.239072 m.239072 type:complete len:110 (-) comp19404_c0_seq11:985-1314(-)
MATILSCRFKYLHPSQIPPKYTMYRSMVERRKSCVIRCVDTFFSTQSDQARKAILVLMVASADVVQRTHSIVIHVVHIRSRLSKTANDANRSLENQAIPVTSSNKLAQD